MQVFNFLNRLLIMLVVFGLITFTNINHAIASPNKASQGMEQLPNIQTKADEAIKGSAYDSNPEYTDNDQSNQGLNEIQGTADFDKMKRSPSENVPSIIKEVEQALDKK